MCEDVVKLRNPTLKQRLQILRNVRAWKKLSEEEIEEVGQNSESMSFGELSKYVGTGCREEGEGKERK